MVDNVQNFSHKYNHTPRTSPETCRHPRQVNNLVPPGRRIIWQPLETDSLWIFLDYNRAGKTLWACVQITHIFQRNSFMYRNLSLLAPYSQLFQWRLSTPYRLVHPAAVWLVAPYSSPVYTIIRILQAALSTYLLSTWYFPLSHKFRSKITASSMLLSAPLWTASSSSKHSAVCWSLTGTSHQLRLLFASLKQPLAV